MKKIFCIFYICLTSLSVFSQITNSGSNPSSSGITNNPSTASAPGTADMKTSTENSMSFAMPGTANFANPQIAISSPDYRVTAGDIYTLAFMAGNQAVEYTIPVDSSYRIRVANLGTVDGAGMTYTQLKNRVESVVNNNYPMGGVQFILTRPAVFKVTAQGEVKTAREISSWALVRLSALMKILEDDLTARASLRDVTIRSSNGQARTYDLFKAQRFGDVSQDPYLRPGDVITFNYANRRVTVNGAVERPGTYQLQEGENLQNLIDIYGAGFTPIADKTRMELIRHINSSSISGDKIFLAEKDIEANYALEDYDVLTVPEITALSPVMFVEGAVTTATQELAGAELAAANRLVVSFNYGETYASLVRRNKDWFVAASDTENAYIIRKNAYIAINLNPLLYDATYRSEVFIEDNDTLIIPFRQYFVSVAGAVVHPGRYPYIPDRDWEYYIGLAGGFVADRNAFETVTITTTDGKKRKKTEPITPETVITAKTNHWLYYFNQFAPVVTTVLSIVTTYLSIQTYLSR